MEIWTKRSRDHEFDFCPELQKMVSARRAVGQTGKIFTNLDSLSD